MVDAGVFSETLKRQAFPTVEELGGIKCVEAFGRDRANDLYADRIVWALHTWAVPLSIQQSEIIYDILAQNPYPLVLAQSASLAVDMALPSDVRQRVQNRLTERSGERKGLGDFEMASECLAAAFLFAGKPDGKKPAFIAVLDDIKVGEAPMFVRRASVLAGLAWLWRRSPDLEIILSRLSADDEAGEQAEFELGMIALDNALNSSSEDEVVEGLATASTRFAQAHILGPEMVEAEALSIITKAIVEFASDSKSDQLERDLNRAMELAVERALVADSAAMRSWLRPRRDLQLAWDAVSHSLKGLQAQLAKNSWLRAVPVLEQIASLRRALVTVSNNEGDFLRTAVTDRIGRSFLSAEGLRAHLEEWAVDEATDLADRTEASALLATLRKLENAGGNSERSVDAPASDRIEIGADELQRLHALADLAKPIGFNGKTEEVFLALDAILAGHPDYIGNVQSDVRQLVRFIVIFLGFCLDVTPHMAKDLFDFLFDLDGHKPLEAALQRAFWTFLKLQTAGFPTHQVVRELPDVATGRADVAIVRPDWRIVVEVKRELHDASREGIRKYLGQAATYTLTGPRISFLLVLDLCGQKDWALTLTDNLWVEMISDLGETTPRMVCVCRIPGFRKPPSSVVTPSPEP